MALKPICSDGNIDHSGKDLPWVNVYGKTHKDDRNPYVVHNINDLDSGFMVITSVFKGFVHDGTQLHRFLRQALDVYCDMRSPVFMLVATVSPGRKLELSLDDEKTVAFWHKSENRYIQVVGDPNFKLLPEDENPLLAGMGVRTPAHTQEDTGSSGKPSVPAEGSTKPRKAPKITQ